MMRTRVRRFRQSDVVHLLLVVTLTATTTTCLPQTQRLQHANPKHQPRNEQQRSLVRGQGRAESYGSIRGGSSLEVVATNRANGRGGQRKLDKDEVTKDGPSSSGAGEDEDPGPEPESDVIPAPSISVAAVPTASPPSATVESKSKGGEGSGSGTSTGAVDGAETDAAEASKKDGSTRPSSKKKYVIPLASFTLELDHTDKVTEATIVSILVEYLRGAMNIRDGDILTLRMKKERGGKDGGKERGKVEEEEEVGHDDDDDSETNTYTFEGSVTMHYDSDPGYSKSIQQSLLWRRQKAALVDDHAELEAALAGTDGGSELDASGSASNATDTNATDAVIDDPANGSGQSSNSTANNGTATDPESPDINSSNSSAVSDDSTTSSVHVVKVDMTKVVENGGAGLTDEELSDDNNSTSASNDGRSYNGGGSPGASGVTAEEEEMLIRRHEFLTVIISGALFLLVTGCCLLKLIDKRRKKLRRGTDEDEITADVDDIVETEGNGHREHKNNGPAMTPKQQFWSNISRTNHPIRCVQLSSKQQDHDGLATKKDRRGRDPPPSNDSEGAASAAAAAAAATAKLHKTKKKKNKHRKDPDPIPMPSILVPPSSDVDVEQFDEDLHLDEVTVDREDELKPDLPSQNSSDSVPIQIA